MMLFSSVKGGFNEAVQMIKQYLLTSLCGHPPLRDDIARNRNVGNVYGSWITYIPMEAFGTSKFETTRVHLPNLDKDLS
jgi:hypothetical protein